MCYDNDRLLLEEICSVFIEMLVDLEDIYTGFPQKFEIKIP